MAFDERDAALGRRHQELVHGVAWKWPSGHAQRGSPYCAMAIPTEVDDQSS
jgi:hypothetical protein